MKYNIWNSFTESEKSKGKQNLQFYLSQEDKCNICSDLNAYKTTINGKLYFVRYLDGKIHWIRYKKSWDYEVYQFILGRLKSIAIECNYKEYFNALLKSATRITWKEMEELCPNIELCDNDRRCLLKQIDPNHANDIIYEEFKCKIQEWGFNYVDGKLESGSQYRGLHYKRIADNVYLVFSIATYYPKMHNYALDLWECYYHNEKEIGKKNPVSIVRRALSFEIDRDYHLIKEYVESK